MIEIKDIVVKYGDFDAVKGVSFSVADGEFFTLLGPSGCGKTTTLRTIAGFEKLASGTIILNGKDISPLSPEERNIGFVFQNYALFPSMSVYDNITFGLKIRHLKKSEIDKKVRDIASLIGITEHLGKKISQISGGQQQRVAIARALVLEPQLLLMDEPLSNLDAKLRVSMRAEIKRIQKELGIVAIYVTHDQEEAMAISDRIAVFNHGQIEQIATPRDLYMRPSTEFVARFVGDINELADGGFVRTEGVRLYHENTGKCIPGRVEESEFLGAVTKTRVRLTDGSAIVSMSFGNACFSAGDDVFVSYSDNDVLSFR